MSASQEQIQLINESMELYRQSIQTDIDYLNNLTQIRKKLDDSRNERAIQLRASLTRMRLSWQKSAQSISPGLNREDSQDTLCELLTDENICMKAINNAKTDLDNHIEYREYISKNSQQIYNDWKANSLEEFDHIK